MDHTLNSTILIVLESFPPFALSSMFSNKRNNGNKKRDLTHDVESLLVSIAQITNNTHTYEVEWPRGVTFIGYDTCAI